MLLGVVRWFTEWITENKIKYYNGFNQRRMKLEWNTTRPLTKLILQVRVQ